MNVYKIVSRETGVACESYDKRLGNFNRHMTWAGCLPAHDESIPESREHWPFRADELVDVFVARKI